MTLRIVHIDNVLPGALLADNVNDANGRILLREGVMLTESSLLTLRRRGVETLSINLQEVLDPEHLAVERARLEQALQIRFRRAGASLAAGVLQQATLEVLLERNN